MDIAVFLSAIALIFGCVYLFRRILRKDNSQESGKREDINRENILKLIKQKIDERIRCETKGLLLSAQELRAREQAAALLRDAAINSCLGDASSREYLKDTIREVLCDELEISEEEVFRVISFNKPERMSARDKFEYLYALYKREYVSGVFSRMVSDFRWDRADMSGITEEDIETAYDRCRFSHDFSDLIEVIVQRSYAQLYGHDCADIPIMDESIDSVCAGTGGLTRYEYNYMEELFGTKRAGEKKDSLSYDTLYCVYKGKLLRLWFLGFGSEAALKRVVKNICRYNAGSVLSAKQPVLTGTLANNSRVTVARPPVADGWLFFVRKFASSHPLDIASLLVHKGSDRVIAVLKAIVKGEHSFVISGNTGGGKTTLLKAIAGMIDPHYSIRVAESSFELNLNNLYPERNIVVLQERGVFSIYDAITSAKKMDTDVMIIGEVNEPKLAGAYIQIAQSGSRMAVTTLHHETTKGLIEYLRNALIGECGITDPHVAQAQVVDVVDFDIHMVHDVAGNHYIERITGIISESDNTEGSYHCKNIVEYDKDKKEYKFDRALCFDESGELSALFA